jgi:hypothetical protein
MTPRACLFVNCFERDYRQVLSPGFMQAKAAQFHYAFHRIVVTINNVNDRQNALRLADAAVTRREIDNFLEVEQCLPRALDVCGLKAQQLGRVRHYIDFALVAVVNAAPHYLLYCCAEVDLLRGGDWVTSALEKLQNEPRFLIANPAWTADSSAIESEALFKSGEYFAGNGFSDQCFLANANRLAAKIYGFKHPSGSRYPLSGMGEVFEQRIDAYMRTNGLLRLTDPRVQYIHHGPEGTGYPQLPLWKRVQRKLHNLLSVPRARIALPS